MNNEEVSRRSQRPHKDRGGRGRGSILKRIFLWALSLFVLAFVALAALFFYYASSAPTITENDLKSQTTTRFTMPTTRSSRGWGPRSVNTPRTRRFQPS